MNQRSDLIRYLIWGLILPFLFLNIWVLGQVFLFFEQVITITLVAAIFALLLSYPVHWLERHHVKRFPAILLVLALVIALLVLLGFTVIPLVIEQSKQLSLVLPKWFDGLTQQMSWLQQLALRYKVTLDFKPIVNQLEQSTRTSVALLPGLAIGTLGRLIDLTLVVVLALYMLLDGSRTWNGLIHLLPSPLGPAFNRALQFNARQFFMSQFLLALFMLLGLIPIFILLQVKFALLLALIVAIFELIPFIGAAIGILLVTFLTLVQGLWPAFWVAVCSIILQQIRDNIIAPRLLGQFIGLSPIWILVSLLVGGRVAGVLGVILAIPVAGTIKGTVEQLRSRPSPDLEAPLEAIDEPPLTFER
jgi:predicted PurR-regulated permease PerM